MDLSTVTCLLRPSGRADLAAVDAGAAVLAGGTWLFSEPQHHLHTLVDVTGLGWPPLTATDVGLSIAATCTFAELSQFTGPADWSAVPLFSECCHALAGSFKIWNSATVGGNICLALPAGPMTSLVAALDGVAVMWGADGSTRRVPLEHFVTGDRRTVLQTGDVLRALELPAYALEARTAFRRAALAPLGRSGSLVIGRRDADGAFRLTVTAATDRPWCFDFPEVPTGAELDAALADIEPWYDDPHGAPDWRRAVTRVLAGEILDELG